MKCNRCGYQWSSDIADECPRCGSPVVSPIGLGWVGWVILAIAVLGIVYLWVDLLF